MDVSKLGSSYVNKTAQNIQAAIDSLVQIADSKDKPILLFMDEVDSLAIKRDKSSDTGENLKTTATLLKMLDQAKNSNLIVIAATNKFDLLDEAFVSRFSETQYVGLPDEEQIKALIKHVYSDKSKAQKLLSDENAINKLSCSLKRIIVPMLQKLILWKQLKNRILKNLLKRIFKKNLNFNSEELAFSV